MLLRKKHCSSSRLFSHFKFSSIIQVLLQTYIEHLRGKVEDLKEVTVNNHGKGRIYI